ncbi:hypothetical protein QOZ80_1AG0015030 [Eleusine coracana subsp. coracana]|nr:hypothetical protein QOZ80_1AG0015030 [Eleusine coracana subsp. coracana]
MNIFVTKSSPVLVGPSEPPHEANTIDLSSFDKSVAGYSITSFLVYEDPIHKPAESIKRALSRALVQYHPIAGRLSQAANGKELTISCTNEGVQFVAVTEFSCGGFVIGTTSNHVIADGEGMAQFLQAISELARGFSQPSITPIRCASSLAKDSPLLASSNKWLMSLSPVEMDYLDITIPSSLISRIKADFDNNQSNVQPCTLFEAAMAILWQCRTRVVMSNPDTPMALLFASSMRKHVGAKDGYYGNCFTMQAIFATSGEVANSHIDDIVNSIKRAKEKVPEIAGATLAWTRSTLVAGGQLV